MFDFGFPLLVLLCHGYEKFLESKQFQFLVVKKKLDLNPEQYTNTWQSESDIDILRIKPDILEYFGDHPDHYIFVPIRFISEHIEVLFDNDMKCYESCQ